VAARSKAFLRGRSLGGMAGLKPAGGVDGRILCLLCVVEVEASANELSLVQRNPTDCVCV